MLFAAHATQKHTKREASRDLEPKPSALQPFTQLSLHVISPHLPREGEPTQTSKDYWGSYHRFVQVP